MKKMFSVVFITDCNGRKDADRVMSDLLDTIEEKYKNRDVKITNSRIKDIGRW